MPPRARVAPPGSGVPGSGLLRTAALAVGAGYVVVGVVGFVVTGFTGFVADTDEALLGFDLNIFHNVVHVAIGAVLILVSRLRDITVTQGVVMGGGLFYIVAALLGFLNDLQIISINARWAPDNFLHLASGVVAFLVGLISALQQDRALAREDRRGT